MNKVLLTGRLSRDPELRTLANGKAVTQFTLATNEYRGHGEEKAEYHNVVTWDRLAEICGQYIGKGQLVAVEGRLQTRSWDDDRGQRHWKTEIVATSVEMLSGRRKRDYEAETVATTGDASGAEATAGASTEPTDEDDEEEGDEAEASRAESPVAVTRRVAEARADRAARHAAEEPIPA